MKTETEFRATENLFKEKVRWIQDNPNAPSVMVQLKDLYYWVGAAPYVRAAHNTQYIPGFMENGKYYAKFDILFWEYTYAQIACSFSTPSKDQKTGCVEAGLKSMIACYRNISTNTNTAKWEFMDNYISRLDSIGVPKFLKGIEDSTKAATTHQQ